MHYSNPPLPTLSAPTNEHRELIKLLAVVGALLIALVVGGAVLATYLAQYIPFSAERQLAATFGHLSPDEPLSPEQAATQAALEALVGRLVPVMALPADMTITVHYLDQPVVNAFATLGGHLFVYRGLIERLESEQALVAVLAHEIGHVRQRHVIQGLGRGIAILTALQAMGLRSRAASDWLVGEGANLTVLSFSRDAEREADLAALEASERLYGNVSGVLELFDLFIAETGERGGVELWQTHPLPESRRVALAAEAQRLGYSLQGERIALPPGLSGLHSKP